MKIVITEQQFGIITTDLKYGHLPFYNFKNADYAILKSILEGIEAPVTPHTMGFMYAWRECENSLGAKARNFCNNPFNTTWNTDPKGIEFCSKDSTMYCRKNSAGVKSYKSIDIGVAATIKTIKGGKFQNLRNALVGNYVGKPTCLDIANNLKGDLDIWGTGDAHVISKCTSYLKGSTPKPLPIVRSGDCG